MTYLAENEKIVVVEYPKSGATWLVGMIGDTLSLKKRDIYVNEGYSAFDVSKHPWYDGEESWSFDIPCVIKSHEFPNSPLHDFAAKRIHLIRDGRDVVVSKYFFEKDFCVQNGVLHCFNTSFQEYIFKTATEWGIYVKEWIATGAISCRYEDLYKDTFSTLRHLLNSIDIHPQDYRILEGIRLNTKQRLHSSLAKAFKHNTFVRKAEPGDWVNHFGDREKDIFKACAGELIIELGYATDNCW